MKYLYHCWIPFDLADPAGILFFGHVFHLFHQAFEHFVIEKLECPWKLWFQNSEWIVPIKHAESDYFYPIQPGKNCQIELCVTKISSSSFTLLSTFSQEKLCSTVQTVHVFCDSQTKEKIAIPSFIKEKFFAISLSEEKPLLLKGS